MAVCHVVGLELDHIGLLVEQHGIAAGVKTRHEDAVVAFGIRAVRAVRAGPRHDKTAVRANSSDLSGRVDGLVVPDHEIRLTHGHRKAVQGGQVAVGQNALYENTLNVGRGFANPGDHRAIAQSGDFRVNVVAVLHRRAARYPFQPIRRESAGIGKLEIDRKIAGQLAAMVNVLTRLPRGDRSSARQSCRVAP